MTSAEPKRRDSARLLVFSPAGRLLLFRFTPPDREPFWATPGGALDQGEDFATAARRELFEETGFSCELGEAAAVRHNRFQAWGSEIVAEEHYFFCSVGTEEIDISGHEEVELEVMKDHRWFSVDDLAHWPETIYPEDIVSIIEGVKEPK